MESIHQQTAETKPKNESVQLILLPDITEESRVAHEKLSEDVLGGNIKPMDEKCLHCLCKTINDCQPIKCSKNYTCGIFEISHNYWLDSGKIVLQGTSNYYTGNEGEFKDYLQCVNDDVCSRQTVINYMQRYRADCNDDGIINCYDYISLHLLGPKGCGSKSISLYHKMRMNLCLMN
ncbi:lysozyme-like [Musca vetustissima]|uniref:lysozyme-like n=1 Tax=Musca vetustissima TaxID=27455 RepID=UPI002AB7639F|nr:lysozyme-like [Musca vetustissima]